MSIWHVIDNDRVVDSIIAESKDFVESLYPSFTVVEDDGILGNGWVKESGVWKAPYPTDELEYTWDDERKTWNVVPSPREESIVE
jgi:hypothetical protein